MEGVKSKRFEKQDVTYAYKLNFNDFHLGLLPNITSGFREKMYE